jgi:hypothetical protein
MTWFFVAEANAQLVWNGEKMEKSSAILPLSLENEVYRIRCKPPEGVKPRDSTCDFGITGTGLTDQRGTSSTDAGAKVLGDLRGHDNIDVQFADRVYTDKHDYANNRIVQKYDFDCGINVKYQNKLKIAQLEIRVGYVLPSGDREGFSWTKINTKRRQFVTNIANCDRCEGDIVNLENTRNNLLAVRADNPAQQGLIGMKLDGIARQIDQKRRKAARKEIFERDLQAFASVQEYLKTKINGCQVYVRFRYDDKTLPVDIEELKRLRVRPIQVFENAKDPIKNESTLSSSELQK